MPLGGNCSYVIDSIACYTYPCLRVGLSLGFCGARQPTFVLIWELSKSDYHSRHRRGTGEADFPSLTEIVVVGQKGKRKRFCGQQETKVTRAVASCPREQMRANWSPKGHG